MPEGQWVSPARGISHSSGAWLHPSSCLKGLKHCLVHIRVHPLWGCAHVPGLSSGSEETVGACKKPTPSHLSLPQHGFLPATPVPRPDNRTGELFQFYPSIRILSNCGESLLTSEAQWSKAPLKRHGPGQRGAGDGAGRQSRVPSASASPRLNLESTQVTPLCSFPHLLTQMLTLPKTGRAGRMRCKHR